MSVMAQFAIFPTDKGDSVAPYVARAIQVIKDSGLPYVFGPMGTTIEGEWSEVMDCITRCHQVLEEDSDRIYLALTMDSRKGRVNGLKTKVEHVEQILSQKNA